MTTTNQGLSFAEIEHIVAMRVASAIETIAIYKTKTRLAHDSRNQVERHEDNVTENASKKRKWEGDQSRCVNCTTLGHALRSAAVTRECVT
ncbi:hypothetical protein Tco_0481986 [Tanacetum coccineum]